ncbi:hypothetical protein TeGR_g13616 [Tetraparma gracilis]|uniref:Cyclic nucleotide-binding domain-containing protein n=1 Tax=Tetraparma gracilis TaxID=2962635 RepID=A0ABQ6NBX5_9STRA|nr:hypothetical protein TeGR_g13616 [Tetraparma gracilis]
MYFIRQGKAEITQNGTKYGTTFDGSYFGELPFLFSECIHRQPFETQERRNNLKRQSTVANNVEAMQRRRELAELVEGQE